MTKNCRKSQAGCSLTLDTRKFLEAEYRCANLLIGADGIKSAVRANLIGDGEPRYLQNMSWRAVIKCDQ